MTNETECLLRFLDDLDFAAGVVNRDQTFLFLNRAMRRTLDEMGQPAGPAFQQAVESVRSDGRERSAVIDLEPQGARWSLRLWPFDADRVAFYGRPLASPDRQITRVATRLALEPAEARLALQVSQGKSNLAIARLFGVKVGTVKTRLWALFRRVRVRNRTELATRILECLVADAADQLTPFHRAPAFTARL